MTVLRVSLAADQRYPMVSHAGHEPVDLISKRRLLRHQPIQSMTLVVVMLLLDWTTAQRISEERVSNAMPGQGGLQSLAVELRGKTGVWIGANIHYELDPLLRQQLSEAVKWMTRMSDSPDR
jgi:hypothetical protein